MKIKYIVFYKSSKRFIAGVKYLISTDNIKNYFIGTRSKTPLNKSREGNDYYVGHSLYGNDLA